MKQPAHCKYTPLEDYLRQFSVSGLDLTLSFEQIESAMNSKLPKSAYERVTWWDNDVQGTLSHKNAWLNVGLGVEEVNLAEKWVRFVRAG